MPPVVLLIAVVGVTVVAAVIDALIDRARRARLAALASTWGMRFTPDDRFQLTSRIAARFPTPGAADVVVRDLMYAEDGPDAFRYLFTVEYTVGVIRTKRRRLGVGTVREATRAGGGSVGGAEPFSDVTLAPRDLPMTQQYEWLRARTTAAEPQ
jgi:hypothetical protein